MCVLLLLTDTLDYCPKYWQVKRGVNRSEEVSRRSILQKGSKRQKKKRDKRKGQLLLTDRYVCHRKWSWCLSLLRCLVILYALHSIAAQRHACWQCTGMCVLLQLANAHVCTRVCCMCLSWTTLCTDRLREWWLGWSAFSVGLHLCCRETCTALERKVTNYSTERASPVQVSVGVGDVVHKGREVKLFVLLYAEGWVSGPQREVTLCHVMYWRGSMWTT